jgi:hypothetical protein
MRIATPSLPHSIPLTYIFFVSLALRSPSLELDSPLQVLWHLASQPAPEVAPEFKPLVAPLLAPTVPPGFLPRAAPTAAPRAVLASSAALTAVPDGPPPCEWLASPIAYVRRPQQPTPAGTTPPPPLQPPPAGGQCVVVPVTPPENPHQMVTRREGRLPSAT